MSHPSLRPENHFAFRAPEASNYLVFFIPGNPGQVSYYEAFLAHLALRLRNDTGPIRSQGSNSPLKAESSNLCPTHASKESKVSASSSHAAEPSIVGVSLANFGKQADYPAPLGLLAQIEYIESALNEWSNVLRTGTGPVTVVLVGHSVGAYIGMELLQRWQKNSRALPHVKITGFIGLWPTVTWIARSESGQQIGWLLRFKHLAICVSIVAVLLARLCPRSLLRRLVSYITKFPEPALETTVEFISRGHAVQQSLHMARDEMEDIAEDSWEDRTWDSGVAGPRLMFLFGRKDHWVQDEARDDLMKRRGILMNRSGAIMEIDKGDIPHGFCIRDSTPVAEKTAGMVKLAICAR